MVHVVDIQISALYTVLVSVIISPVAVVSVAQCQGNGMNAQVLQLCPVPLRH